MTDKAMPPEPNNKLPTKEQDGGKQQTLTWIDSLIALDELDNHVLRTLKAMLAAAPEPAPQEPKSEPAGVTSAAEKQVGSPVGAAPLPDGVAAMVERLALIYGRSAISADNEDYLCMFSLKDCREVKEMLERLARELAKHQESSFHPDWSMLEATRESLREHMRELAAVKAENENLLKDAERLDFLDQNIKPPFNMGWEVGKAPAGNIRVGSVIQIGCPAVDIRAAIDAAMKGGK